MQYIVHATGGHLDTLCRKASTATASPKHGGSALVPAAYSKASKGHLSWAKTFDNLISKRRVDSVAAARLTHVGRLRRVNRLAALDLAYVVKVHPALFDKVHRLRSAQVKSISWCNQCYKHLYQTAPLSEAYPLTPSGSIMSLLYTSS